MSLNQDTDLYVGLLDGDESVTFEAREGRGIWIHVATGSVSTNGRALTAGDGAAVTQTGELQFENGREAEVLVFDMAKYG